METGILERLLVTLAVPLRAFSVCEIQSGWRLSFPVFEAITIHYVLAGTGSLRVGDGSWLPFGPQSLLVIPTRQAHVVGQASTVRGETRAEDHCSPFNNGLVKFTAGGASRE